MAKKEKIQYPNPEFWKCKDEIDWAKQWENLKEVGGIAWDLLKATDWKQFGQDRVNDIKADIERVKDEYKDFMALDADGKKDRILNGEKSLGRLYRKGAMATVRREWRGIKDTAYDFYEWARMWGMLLMTFSKDLIPALNGALYYRWMISYFCCHGFMDKNIMGLRGSNLRMSHLLIYDIFRYVAENLVLSAKADEKNGNSGALNQRTVLFDEMTMGQIMGGFPDLYGFPHQLLGVFLVSEIDQLTCVPYIDAVESYGLPSDTCPVPSSECGALVIDALPHMGSCFLSSSMPCDGSTMASSYYSRRFPNTPVFHLCFPVRYMDEETVQMGAEDIRACIKFIEERTGAKWNWDAYFTMIKRFNQETAYELREVGSQQVCIPAASRPLLRAVPQVELRDGRRRGSSCHQDLREGQQHPDEGLREQGRALARQDEVPRYRVVLPGSLLCQLLQLACKLLGRQRPGRDGVPELHQAS